MRLLSFDTSTSDLHICLSKAGQIEALCTLDSNLKDRQYAASLLLPAIQNLFDQANWQKSDLNAIVVGVGPGSFTGVRTAVVTGRTIAQALNLPLIGVPILECYAYKHGSSAAVVLRAGPDQFFVGAYEVAPLTQPSLYPSSRGLNVSCTLAPACLNREAIFEMLKIAGDCLLDAGSLALFEQTQARLKPLPHLNNIAVVQSELALNRVSLSMTHSGSGRSNQEYLLKTFPYDQVQPLYLRSASVTLKKTN